MNCTHKHVECSEDIDNELFELLSSAKELYSEMVTDGGMRHDCFVEQFCASRHHIDCDRACCRNAHRMNMIVARGILLNKALVEERLLDKPFTMKDCSALQLRHLTQPLAVSHEGRTTLGSRFTDEQKHRMAEIAFENNLFCVHSLADAKNAIENLLHCRKGFSVKVRNIRNVTVFFDELLAHELIAYSWQSVLEKAGLLVCPRSEGRVKASDLSSALNKTKNSSTATQRKIRNAIRDMQK